MPLLLLAARCWLLRPTRRQRSAIMRERKWTQTGLSLTAAGLSAPAPAPNEHGDGDQGLTSADWSSSSLGQVRVAPNRRADVTRVLNLSPIVPAKVGVQVKSWLLLPVRPLALECARP